MIAIILRQIDRFFPNAFIILAPEFTLRVGDETETKRALGRRLFGACEFRAGILEVGEWAGVGAVAGLTDVSRLNGSDGRAHRSH